MKRKDGFTFIEVALVLAIAALIFLMAFLALPSLWMSQRDADRKAKVMEFISDIKTYQANNSRGALPELSSEKEMFTLDEDFWEIKDGETPPKPNSWQGFARNYVSKDFEEASGRPYKIFVINCKAAGDQTGNVCTNEDTNTETLIKFSTINDPYNVNLESGVDDTIYVVIGATCEGDHAVKTNSTRSVAAVQVLERAGRYCYNT